MITKADYPHLASFIACTFHQDWDYRAATFRAVIDLEVFEMHVDAARPIANEIAALLASTTTEDELTTWLDVVGCCVITHGFETETSRAFLEMIAERLAKRLA